VWLRRLRYTSSVKRAYGHEPILLAASPVTQHTQPTTPAAKRSWRKRALIVTAAIVIAACAAVFILRKPADSSSRYSLGQMSQNVAFPLYAPTWLPEGWFVHRQSLSVASEVVTFTVNDSKGQRLVFTEQPKPPQENLDTFYNQQLSGSTTTDSAAGRVTMGQFEGSSIAGISGERTWILIRTVSSVDQQDFDRLVHGLRKME
jgi:hypothetical protein